MICLIEYYATIYPARLTVRNVFDYYSTQSSPWQTPRAEDSPHEHLNTLIRVGIHFRVRVVHCKYNLRYSCA